MKRIALVCALLVSAPALAQSDPYLTTDYVESHRPAIAKRALSGSEKAQARELVRQIETAPTEALLDQLRPLANSGDRTLMRAMWKGYGKAKLTTRVADDPLSWQLRIIVEAQWAIELWRADEEDRDIALTISNCFGHFAIDARVNERRDCGYSARATEGGYRNGDSFSGYADKVSKAPNVVFAERRPTLGPGWARRRFEGIVSQLRDQKKGASDTEIAFANSYAQYVVPALNGFWRDARDLDDYRVDRKRRGELAGAHAKLLTAWLDIGKRRQTAGQLSEADRNAWFKLSTQLGGNSLYGYASVYPLTEMWQIESVCAHGAGEPDQTVCKVQRGQHALRVSGAATGPKIPVQSYDVGGSPSQMIAVPRSAFEYFR